MKRTMGALALASALLTLANAAHASNQPAYPREICREDAHHFCANAGKSDDRIRECLEDHYKEISDACYDAFKNASPPPEQGLDQATLGQSTVDPSSDNLRYDPPFGSDPMNGNYDPPNGFFDAPPPDMYDPTPATQ